MKRIEYIKVRSFVKLNNALELRKSKYIKRWKGKDGKWKYLYSRLKLEKKQKVSKVKVKKKTSVDLFTRNLKQKEKEISKLKYEECHSFDKDGNILLSKKGGQTVRFSAGELKKLKNAKVITHNHVLPFSFSLSDMKLLHTIKPDELRAVTREYTHIAKIPKKWTEDDFTLFIANAEIMYESNLMEIEDKKMSSDQANEFISHQVWTNLNNFNGFKYKRIKK